MKITDYTVIQSEIETQLLEQDWTIEEYLPDTTIVIAVANIYTTADMGTGFGQDFTYTTSGMGGDVSHKLSIISNNQRISIISEDGMSYYKSDVQICGYEDLTEDIYNIFVIIQTVFDRINAL